MKGLPRRGLQQITLASGPTCSTTLMLGGGPAHRLVTVRWPLRRLAGDRFEASQRPGRAGSRHGNHDLGGSRVRGSQRLARGDGHPAMPAVFQSTYDAARSSTAP